MNEGEFERRSADTVIHVFDDGEWRNTRTADNGASVDASGSLPGGGVTV